MADGHTTGANPARSNPSATSRSGDGSTSPTRGLIIVGPAHESSEGLDELLAFGGATLIKANAEDLSTWYRAAVESLVLARQVSQVLRSGALPVVALDVQLGGGSISSPQIVEFIGDRLARIIIGLADQPAYLALHGELLARSIVNRGLHERRVQVLEMRPDETEIWRLSDTAMYPGLRVGVCPGGASMSCLVNIVERLETNQGDR